MTACFVGGCLIGWGRPAFLVIISSNEKKYRQPNKQNLSHLLSWVLRFSTISVGSPCNNGQHCAAYA